MLWRILTLASLLLAPGWAYAQELVPPSTERYELAVRIDYDEERLAGTARLTLRNTSAEPVTEVPLMLYRLMSIYGASDPRGRSLQVTQDVVQYSDFTKLQSTAARVLLREPLAPGEATVIEVRYGGHLLGYAETGMAYIRDRIDPAFTILRPDADAFPTVGHPSMTANRAAPLSYFDYRASIDVPDSLVVVNAGRLVQKTTEAGRATYEFESRKPSWRMDFAIGDYRELDAGAVRIHYLAEDSAGAARVARTAERGLELFESRLGPLQSDDYLAVIELEDGFGSQADVAAILQAAAAFRDSARANELYHELSHLWNPPDTDQPSARWNEGLATFLEWYAVEQIEGEQVLDWVGNWLVGSVRSSIDRSPALERVPLVDYGREQLSGSSYGVGGLFFHVFYRVVGEEATMSLLRDYYQENARRGAGAREFIEQGSELGPPARRLFEDWWLTTRWTEIVQDADDLDDIVAAYQGRP